MKRNSLRVFCMVFACMIMALFSLASAEAQESSIPVVKIIGESLSGWMSKKDVRDAVLTYEENGEVIFTANITIQPQGTSSMAYDKKNFTIKLPEGGVEVKPEWGVQSEYCLKANYIDPTHAGNVVSAGLAAQMNQASGLFADTPNHGAIDGFPIWVLLNGEPEGLYTWNIPKAAWMFGMDENNPDHIVMCCEGWSDACLMFTDAYVPDEDWSLEVGPDTPETAEKFTRLLNFIANSSDEEFVRNFDQYLNLDACLNYYCFIAISSAGDNIAKNMLLATYDGKVWYPVLYDLDSLWGITADGKETIPVLPESIAYTNHRLFTRIRELFTDEMIARYFQLRGGILSKENIWAAFNAFRASVPAAYFELDGQMWNPEGKLMRTYETMEELMSVNIPQVDAIFGYKPASVQ